MIIVLAAGLISTASIAQNDVWTSPPAPPTPPEMKDLPPAPPPPPVPPFTPAPPPIPPKLDKKHLSITTNNKGYTVKIIQTENEEIILLRKKGVIQKIKMDVWIAKPQYFENKYGELPPPPPPPPLKESF